MARARADNSRPLAGRACSVNSSRNLFMSARSATVHAGLASILAGALAAGLGDDAVAGFLLAGGGALAPRRVVGAVGAAGGRARVRVVSRRPDGAAPGPDGRSAAENPMNNAAECSSSETPNAR